MNIVDAVMAFLKDEEGASGIEYALIAVMVAVVIAGFTTPISSAVTKIFNDIVAGLPK